MTADPQGQAWVDKGALTEAVAKLSAAVDRADKDAIIDCYTATPMTTTASSRDLARSG
jgi:hypothetical protein